MVQFVENIDYTVVHDVFVFRVNLYKDVSAREGSLSHGERKAALEWKYGLRDVSDDPEPLINYLDVSKIVLLVTLVY